MTKGHDKGHKGQMSDRELLGLAAKAAGINVAWSNENNCYWTRADAEWWNPLTDDGDAFRLAVKLLLELDLGLGCVTIRHSSGMKIREAFNHDPYAATRRAIVRAAAEVGRDME